MKKVIYIILLAAIASACARNAVVEAHLLEACSPSNGGKDVATSGYLDDKSAYGLLCSNPGAAERPSCQYYVLEKPGGETVFAAFIDKGFGKNQAEEPAAGYSKEDLKIRDDKGSVIAFSDRVKLTGRISVTPEGRFCSMLVDRIER